MVVDLEKKKRTIRALVVDDSALVRKLLTEVLDSDPGIEVVGAASDPYVAREKIKKLNPDVITLDIEMPRMDGLTFLSNLMRLRPMPVVMVSTLTEQGAEVTLRALELGAVDFIAKPKVDLARGLEQYAEELCTKVKTAAQARVGNRTLGTPRARTPRGSGIGPGQHGTGFSTTEQVIAIGASTGGTEAIRQILTQMPADAPGMVISQHIPEAFSGPFAQRLNASVAMNVSQAQDGQQILRGHVYIAPGDRHLQVVRDGARYLCRLDQGSKVNRHRPSVDVMFRSVLERVGTNSVGVLLTGMGEDGASGLKEMYDAGVATVVQDEASSVVWGMPGSAVRLGAAQHVVPLLQIADAILDLSGYHAEERADHASAVSS